MAERPLLQISRATRNERIKKAPAAVDPNAKISRPRFQGQGGRLGPRFDRLREVAAQPAARATMLLRADPDGIAPERAIVFEVAGSLGDFYSQAGRIQGLEFLLEDDVELPPDHDFHIVETKKGEQIRSDEPIGGRLYMAMPDLRALQEILRLWDIYRRGAAMPRGFGPWKTLFELLRDVRAWGPADRVPPETLDYRRERARSAARKSRSASRLSFGSTKKLIVGRAPRRRSLLKSPRWADRLSRPRRSRRSAITGCSSTSRHSASPTYPNIPT